jgi:hypothetical protein
MAVVCGQLVSDQVMARWRAHRKIGLHMGIWKEGDRVKAEITNGDGRTLALAYNVHAETALAAAMSLLEDDDGSSA